MRIVSTDPVPAEAAQAFAGIGPIEVWDGPGGAAVAAADVLVVRTAPVGQALLEHAHRLRCIARTGAGVDNLDVDAATTRGVPIVYAPAVGAVPMAEGTVALILAAAKRLGELGDVIARGAWEERYARPGLDLRDAVVGVVGLGAIGREVARLCSGLGMRVVAHDPGPVGSFDASVEMVDLAELAARADVITLHCGLDDTTRGLVDRDFLARVKRGAILVNAARGRLVDGEDTLAEALERGTLAAVALDVFPHEPPDPSHPLYADRRVVCTPHAVGLTRRWNVAVFGALADSVAAVLRGERTANVLNPEALLTAL